MRQMHEVTYIQRSPPPAARGKRARTRFGIRRFTDTPLAAS